MNQLPGDSPRLVIGVPLSSDAGRPTVECVAGITALYDSGLVQVLRTLWARGAVWACRREIAEQFMGLKEATHLLMVDSDVGFYPQHVTALLRHEKPVISGLYVTRASDGDVRPVAFADRGDGKWVPPVPSTMHGLHRLEAGGLGFILVAREALEKLPRPWFEDVREDLGFFAQLRDLEVPAWIDYDVNVIHVGPYWYTREDAERAYVIRQAVRSRLVT